MFYSEQTAKLTQIANKQTMFLIHMLFYVDYHEDSKQYILDLSPARKIEILHKIGNKTNGSTNLANQYLHRLSKANIIKSIGRGRWLINPIGFSNYQYIKKKYRDSNARIYENRVFTDQGVEVDTYIIDEDGERHDLT